MGLVACLKDPFDSRACGWLEVNPLPSPAQKKVVADTLKKRSVPACHPLGFDCKCVVGFYL